MSAQPHPGYGEHEHAMQAYLQAGEARAYALGNRGPVRYDAHGNLHPDILEAYWRVGFYVFEGVMRAEELADMEADLQRIRDNLPVHKGARTDAHGRPALGADLSAPTLFWSRPLADPFGGTDAANGRHQVKMFEPPAAKDAPDEIVYLILGSLQFSDACLRLYGHPDLLRVAAAVNGEDFVPFNEAMFIKEPGLGASVAWHQDGATHWKSETWDAGSHGFNFMGQLYGCTAANGVWVVPGSHKAGKVDIKALVAAAGSERLPDAVPIICAPGDVAMTNRQALHGSFANTSDQWRVTANFGFHRRASVLDVEAGGLHNARAVYDAERIARRARMIGYAIDARAQRFPDETPYVYKPLAEAGISYRWDDAARADIHDYNLLDSEHLNMSETLQFDFVIVGGGSAGCVLANRLSANPAVRVCLLEAGGEDRHPLIHIPAGYVKTMVMPGINWLFDTAPDPATGNRAIPVPRGRVVGGSSSINGLLYVRGQARDYDMWSQLGNRGWSYEDVLPYFRKSERRENAAPDDPLRGTDGPLNVADISETDPVLDGVIESARVLGYPVNPDYNGASQEGFGYFQTTMKNGRRHSAASAYLHPVRNRKNLTVITHAHATGIEFDGKRASGVKFARHGQPQTVSAAREVILSAGAVQSPQLLELSGVGGGERLREAGIDVVHDVPGVGENLQDHYIARVTFKLRGVRTLNERTKGLAMLAEIAKCFYLGRGALTLPAGVAFGFVRTRAELETPDVQYHIAHASFRDPKKRIFDDFPGLTVGPCQLRPESRGSIHITSADPMAAPRIAPNFLHAENDRRTLVDGIKIARSLTSAGPLAQMVETEVTPGADVATDEQILDYAAHTGATVYHPVGTCKMGTDPQAVVDEQLRVHGLQGLRVVDASVMPRLVSGNTNAPTMMIAEKAADMILAAARTA